MGTQNDHTSGDDPVSRRKVLSLVGATPGGYFAVRRSMGRTTPQQGTTAETETVRAYVGSYHWGYFVLDENGDELDQLSLTAGDELHLTLFNVQSEAAIENLPQTVRTNVPSLEERMQRNQQAIPIPQETDIETLHDAAVSSYPDHSLLITDDDFDETRSGDQGQWPRGGHHGPHRPGGGRGPGHRPGGGPGPGDGRGPGNGPRNGHHGPRGPEGGPGPGTPGSGQRGGTDGALAPTVYLWHHATEPTDYAFVVNTTGSFGFVCTVYCGYGHPYMVEQDRIVVSKD